MAEDEPRNPQQGPTLRELMFQNNNNLRPLGITLPNVAVNWELKHSFLKILPKFSDMPEEDPQRHLQDFELACGTIRTQNDAAKEEYIRMVSFPFSLQGSAREWLYTLPKESVNTWHEFQQRFLEKYYPISKLQNARKRLSSIQMGDGETFYGYWCRFKQMLAKCPRHQFFDQDLIQFFVNGLRPIERQLVNAACGGSILNKQPNEAFQLLGDMAEESRDDSDVLVKTPLTTPAPLSSDSEISVLCSTLKQVMEMMKHTLKRSVKVCQSCCGATDTRDEYSILANEEEADAFWHNNYQGQNPQFDQYNSPWRNDENLGYGDTHYQAPLGQHPPQVRGPSLAETVYNLGKEQKIFSQEFEEFKTETKGVLQAIVTQVSNLAQGMTKLDQRQGVLTAQAQDQPNAQVNAIGLINEKPLPKGKRMPSPEKVQIRDAAKEEEPPKAVTLPKVTGKQELKIKPPFSSWIANEEEDKFMRYMVKIFKKVDVNIPFIKVIKSKPRCARILMELFTKTVRYPDNRRFLLGENVSAVLNRDLPVKCKDPGMFTIPCVIGTTKIEQAMLDLGASVNIMPLSMYHELNIGPLKPSTAVIELADKSSVYPEGKIEDVLVKVQDLIFPVDFYVLNMGNTQKRNQLMLLGSPFLMTARTVIDCDSGKMTCNFTGENVTFDLHKADQYSPDIEVADLEDSSGQMLEDALPKAAIKDEHCQDVQGVWMEQESSGEAAIKDKTGAHSQRTDHLCKTSEDKGGTLIDESYSDKLFGIKGIEPWYAHLVSYISPASFPLGKMEGQRNKGKVWDPGKGDPDGRMQ